MQKPKISIVGVGYVGLVAAACFADGGFEVIASTNDSEKVRLINLGKSPFFEPGLDDLISRSINSGKLKAVNSRKEAILNTDITFVSVGTPSRGDGSIDLQFIEQSSKEIGESLKLKENYHLVVVRSTVTPGTTQNLVKSTLERYSNKKAGVDFGLCMSPEFLRQGAAVYDTLYPDRLVIGELDAKSGDILEKFYRAYYKQNPALPILRMNLSSAEMVKDVSNAFLATKISFINEIANICEKVPGIDVSQVAKGVGLDKRIGPMFLDAGVGFGGSCFPKDVKALIAFSKSNGYTPNILETIMNVNLKQAEHVKDLLKQNLTNISGKKIAILGLSFKPNTDDMRESPAIKIINSIAPEGAIINAIDPVATENAKKVINHKVNYCVSINECLKDADAAVLVTDWDQFKRLKPKDFAIMKNRLILDGRRVYDSFEFKEAGYKYVGIGLGEEK